MVALSHIIYSGKQGSACLLPPADTVLIGTSNESGKIIEVKNGNLSTIEFLIWRNLFFFH